MFVLFKNSASQTAELRLMVVSVQQRLLFNRPINR